MLNMKITGLDKLRRELADAQRALQPLNGTIATLKFNPSDPKSVEDAIRQMEAAVDSKTAPYHGNDLVTKVAQGLKDTYRKRILERSNADKE
jgi:hypothetical protein